MAKNTQKIEQKPTIEDDGLDHDPVYNFEPFDFAPKHLDGDAMDEIPSYAVCELVNHTFDIARGAALVFHIIEDHQNELDERCPKPYLNEYQLGHLRRFAARSLEALGDMSSELADLLRKAKATQQSSGGRA